MKASVAILAGLAMLLTAATAAADTSVEGPSSARAGKPVTLTIRSDRASCVLRSGRARDTLRLQGGGAQVRFRVPKATRSGKRTLTVRCAGEGATASLTVKGGRADGTTTLIAGGVRVLPLPAAIPAPAQSPATPATPPATGENALEAGIRDCANRERASRGLAPLTRDATLDKAARFHADNMAKQGFFDHDDPQGRDPGDRIRMFDPGYRAAWAENIAKGYQTAEATCTGWMNSDGHRRNILDPQMKAIGTGVVDRHWVQVFGG